MTQIRYGGSTSAVSGSNRFRRSHPCPICGGDADVGQHVGRRCWGYLSEDGEYAFCTRDEHAGSLAINEGSNAYPHKLSGECKCGTTHGQFMGPSYSEEELRERKRKASSKPNFGREKLTGRYLYCNPDGTVIALKCRFESMEEGVKRKRFIWKRPDGAWGLGPAMPLLYHAEELADAVSVFVVEGEKCVDAVMAEGFMATCSPHGAPDPRVSAKGHLGGKWTPEFTRQLAGKRVVLCPDNDEAGQQFFELIAAELQGVCASVKMLHLPLVHEHGDIADYIALQKFMGEELDLAVLAQNAPVWVSSTERALQSLAERQRA